jgi:hypothetical protein
VLSGLHVGPSRRWSVRGTIAAAIALWLVALAPAAAAHVNRTVGPYVIDHTPDGSAFDPKGGCAWTLLLAGSIERTPLDASFPVTFPSYPRVAAAGEPIGSARPSAPAALAGPWSWLIPAAGATIVLGILLALVIARRRRGVPAQS